MKGSLTNVAASVRQRLLTLARRTTGRVGFGRKAAMRVQSALFPPW